MTSLLPPSSPLPDLFDVNCAVGDWPFRRVPCNTVDRLLRRMSRLGIHRAAVSRLENVFYKDCLSGNRELAALIAGHADRFVPLYVLNPAFPGWERDLDLCVAELGLAGGHGGLRLYPGYHGYSLEGPEAAALLSRAQAMQLTVSVAVRLEDERTHHRLYRVSPVPASALAGVMATFPAVRWLATGLKAPQIAAVWDGLPAGARGPGSGGTDVVFDLSLV